MDNYPEIEAYCAASGDRICIRVKHGSLLDGDYMDLEIQDALLFQWQLSGAIDDYTKAVGK